MLIGYNAKGNKVKNLNNAVVKIPEPDMVVKIPYTNIGVRCNTPVEFIRDGETFGWLYISNVPNTPELMKLIFAIYRCKALKSDLNMPVYFDLSSCKHIRHISHHVNPDTPRKVRLRYNLYAHTQQGSTISMQLALLDTRYMSVLVKHLEKLAAYLDNHKPHLPSLPRV